MNVICAISVRSKAGRSLGEQAVDVLVRNLGERRVEVRLDSLLVLLRLLADVFEDLLELRHGPAHAQAYQAERGPLVEDHHQDDALGDDGDVNVVALALVEEDRELPLS